MMDTLKGEHVTNIQWQMQIDALIVWLVVSHLGSTVWSPIDNLW